MRCFFAFMFILLLFSGCNREDHTAYAHNRIRQDSVEIWRLGRLGNDIEAQYPDSAYALYQQVFEMSSAIGLMKGQAVGLQAMGAFYIRRGIRDSAMFYCERALKYALEYQPPDSALIFQMHRYISIVYAQMGNWKEVVNLSITALGFVQPNMKYDHDYAGYIAELYATIGNALVIMEEYDKALYYCRKGEEMLSGISNSGKVLSAVFLNEVKALLGKNEVDEGLKKCLETQALLKQYPCAKCQSEAHNLLGEIFRRKNDLPAAIASYEAVIADTAFPQLQQLQALRSLGDLYTTMQHYTKGESYLDQALDLGLCVDHPMELSQVYESYSRLLRRKKDYSRALEYNDRFIALRDSVKGTEKTNAVNSMEIKYRAAQKDKEIVEQKLLIASQKVNITKKNTWIGGIVTGAVILSCSFFLFYYFRHRTMKHQQELAMLRASTEGEEKERSRIAHDLHDGIGGQLSSLKMHLGILKNRLPAVTNMDVYQEINRLLDDTVQDVRLTAHNLMPELLLKHGLSEATRIYCQSMQANERLMISYQHYGFIECPDKYFELQVYRIVQELVQNVIKHAGAGFALVQLSQHNDVLDVTVEDNGMGIQDAAGSPTAGLGLESIRQRVGKLRGSFHISSSPGSGTTVYIEFNLKNWKKDAAGTV